MMKTRGLRGAVIMLGMMLAGAPLEAQQGGKPPNILVIMGDDVGWFNLSCYHQGIMSGRTPNLDKLASQGMRFTDYYAEASCTAGRAAFITGEIPLRTGLTTVGQAGADVGMPEKACTIATALKAKGYATGQFGKNHLGDLNKFLPTLHGFDEFFGYLYHLDALSDPYWYSFPKDPAFHEKYGPRNVLHCWATDVDAPLGPDRQAEDRRRRSAAAVSGHVQRPEHAGGAAKGEVQHDDVRRGARRRFEWLHGQGQEGRQAVLRLAQHDPHARLDVPR
jgi:arylsulfatase A-like enzyme